LIKRIGILNQLCETISWTISCLQRSIEENTVSAEEYLRIKEEVN
jgi:hypothetical protein